MNSVIEVKGKDVTNKLCLVNRSEPDQEDIDLIEGPSL